MIWPEKLEQGDTVALIAPSSPVSLETLQVAANSISFLGLVPKIYPSCYSSYGYLSGTDSRRSADLNAAFLDSTVKGIFCLRGGYGATRLLNILDYEAIKNNPKVFCGYSDITALHNAFNNICNFITFHSPMPNINYICMDSFSLNSLKNLIFKGRRYSSIQNPMGYNLNRISGGKTSGRLCGGNLSMLESTLGSPFEINTKEKIIFIEEVNEKFYKIDRSLTALKLAGKFDECNGIILGSFNNCTAANPTFTLSLDEIFKELLAPIGKPIISNLQAGHTYPQNTLPMGSNVFLDADNLTIEFI